MKSKLFNTAYKILGERFLIIQSHFLLLSLSHLCWNYALSSVYLKPPPPPCLCTCSSLLVRSSPLVHLPVILHLSDALSELLSVLLLTCPPSVGSSFLTLVKHWSHSCSTTGLHPLYSITILLIFEYQISSTMLDIQSKYLLSVSTEINRMN